MISVRGPHVGPSTKRACDQCHARKCTGSHPCARCSNGAVECTYRNPLRRKGPVPKRQRTREVEDHALQVVHRVAPDLAINTAAVNWISTPSTPVTQDISPLLTVTLDTLVRPQLHVFFTRIYPMMPIYNEVEVFTRLHSQRWMSNPEWIALLFAITALSLVHPVDSCEGTQRELRTRQATILLDEACRLNGKWNLGVNATVESTMASYCMFGAMHEMGFSSGARLRLREAISLGESMGLDRSESYTELDPVERKRRSRLFWILAVTERAYALQRSGQLTFDRLARIEPGPQDGEDPESLLLRHLASVFSSVDRKLVACWNGNCAKSACRDLTLDQAVATLARLQGSVKDVFGPGETLSDLNEPQKADLLITWQWMRSRVWNLALVHGLTSEDGPPEVSSRHVLDISRTTVGICSRLSRFATGHHGKGFAEKLFDIASLAARQIETAALADASVTQTWIEIVHQLGEYVRCHPASLPDSALVLSTLLQTSLDALRIFAVD